MKHDSCCQEAVVRCAPACQWTSFEKLSQWLPGWSRDREAARGTTMPIEFGPYHSACKYVDGDSHE